jgi:hypothetical protein
MNVRESAASSGLNRKAHVKPLLLEGDSQLSHLVRQQHSRRQDKRHSGPVFELLSGESPRSCDLSLMNSAMTACAQSN